MNAAEQIEHLTRSTIGSLTAASREFSETQQALVARLENHQHAQRTEVSQLRTDLQTAADAADNATPRILLPADIAEASPHGAAATE